MKIGVIGCGNMSQALVKGVYKTRKDLEFHTFTPSYLKAQALAEAVNGIAHKKISDFPKMDLWLIACKPQQFDDLSNALDGMLKDQKVISILAAISIGTIEVKLQTKYITRIMPNTPVYLNEGISLVTHSENVNSEDQSNIESIFKTLGMVYRCENEEQFNLLTVISGSGPAYIFEFAHSYIKLAEQMGMNKNDARKMINQLFFGSAKLMNETEKDLGDMIDAVTSKGGVTIEAINTFREEKLDLIIQKSVSKASQRSEQITQQFG